MIVNDQYGEPVEIFAVETDGMIDMIGRAETREDFERDLVSLSILIEDEDGARKPIAGIDLDHLGPVALVNAAFDTEGVEVSAAVSISSRRESVTVMCFILSARGMARTVSAPAASLASAMALRSASLNSSTSS